MPKRCPRCNETKPTSYPDNAEECQHCCEPLVIIDESYTDEDLFSDAIEGNQYEEPIQIPGNITDDIQSIMAANSIHPIHNQFPIISDIEPSNPECINLQFYNVVREKVWFETQAIFLRIIHNNLFEQKYYCLFLPLEKVIICLNNKENEFRIITGCIRIPSSFIRANCLTFSYKYEFYLKDGNFELEDLCHQSSKSSYRYFYEKIDCPEQINDEPIRRFDTMVVRKKNYLVTKFVPDIDVQERRLISLITLPNYLHIEMFQYEIESKTMDSFLAEFVKRLENIVSFDISPEEKTMCVRWDTDRQKAVTGLVYKYIVYLFQKTSQNKLKDHFPNIFRIYLTIILFQKYSVNLEDILSIIADSLNDVSDALFSSKEYALDCMIDTSVLSRGMSNLINNGPPKTKQFGYFQLIALYHCLFPPKDQHLNRLNEGNYDISEYWGFPKQCKFFNKHPISDKDVRRVFKLASYDPILPYNILYCCSLSKLELFCQIYNESTDYLPLQAILAFFLHKDKSNFKRYMNTLIQFLIEKLKSHNAPDNVKSCDLQLLFGLSLKLFPIIKVLTLNEDDHIMIIDLFNHLYFCLNKISTVDFNKFLVVFKFVKSWYEENRRKAHTSPDLQDEMKFWDRIYRRYSFPNQWSYWITDYLKKRLKQGDFDLLFNEQFIFVQTKLTSDKLKLLFSEEIMNRLKNSKNRESLLTELGHLDANDLKKLTNVLCCILLHEQRLFDLNPTHHLLEWPSWKLYFQFRMDIMVEMNDQAKALISKALRDFSKLIDSINKHEITTAEFQRYSNKQSLILKLVEKMGTSESSQDCVTKGIEYCRSATSWIKDQFQDLKHIRGLLSKIPNFNHSIIKDFIDGQLKNQTTIAQYVTFKEGRYYFTHYPEINKLIYSAFYPPMSSSAQSYKDSCIFPIIFNGCLSSKCHTQEITDFEKLYKEVWKPASEEVQDFLMCCKLNTVYISKVQEYFVHKHDHQSLKQEFNLLSLGTQKIFSNSRTDLSMFSDCCKKIESYFALQTLSDASSMLVRLKEAYSITTDFSLIESLQNVQLNFQHKRISSINDELIQLITPLKGFASHNITVMDEIIKNIDIILWVKSKLELNQLKNFVEIALTTCGEQNIVTYHFSSVCTNLEAIIFPITAQTTYNSLILQFNKIFPIIQDNKDILTQLNHISKHTQFLDELIQSQGSLEETTISQINQIASSGIFTVSSHTSPILDNMVQVVVKRDDGERKYNMEQLQDLRSKLNLIVVNLESEAEEKSHIDKPSKSQTDTSKFNNICDLLSDLASVIKDLGYKGDIASFDYKFRCKLEEAEKVEIEIKVARVELEKRTADIEKARREYYFLNYFTISQIVLLQKGLISFIDNCDIHCQEQMYHLLCLLPLDFNKQNVQSALERAGIITCSDENDLNKSSSFQSGTNVMHYNFIGAKNFTTPGKFVKEDISKVTKFPETFSPKEKTIAEEVLACKNYSVQLITSGIESLKSKGEEIKTQSLTLWCARNKCINLSSTTHQYVPQMVAEFFGFDRLDIFLLGKFLKEFYSKSNRQLQNERVLYKLFKIREPNLVLVPSYLIYESILSLYQSSPNLPLPFYSEVLICSDYTSVEEIDIFWRRALFVSDYNDDYIYCLVSIEKLQYQVAVQAVSLLWKLLQFETNSFYKLILICSDEEEQHSYMAAAFENYKRPSHIATIPSLNNIYRYLQGKFYQPSCSSKCKATWLVDRDKSRVRLLVSDNVGAGKSFYINSLKSDMLKQRIIKEDYLGQAIVTVVMHGKQTSEEHITEQLLRKDIFHVNHGILFHVDIASTLQMGLEQILFKLLVLGGLCKQSGEFWHCRLEDYYIIETTVNPQDKQRVNLIKLFPSIRSFQPRLVMDVNMNLPKDTTYLTKECFRRTFAYLKELSTNINMDKFVFNNSNYPEVQSNEMLSILLSQCGIQDPSWTELNNFVVFLSKQLSDCDQSDYCKTDLMKEEWVGFKSLVVKFVILMSRDFATPSLRGEVEKTAIDTLQIHQIVDKRRWENSSHPYIFFNQDGHTMTFLGFVISNRGDLMDSIVPTTVIKPDIIRPDLMKILKHNNVNLFEDFQKLNRDEKIDKFSKVMGIKELTDPDPGYVLTLDNVRKILAIYMRFRCSIPVVIMGETGCGKTRLIQFMCSLLAQQTGAKNLLILKVHGSTSENDVIHIVEKVEELARKNFNDHDIDTILFFDEANTSPAIGLIKEIMCDRRMYGRYISGDIRLQFIAACNPYRRHTKEMLHKLSTAGLGFFTKSAETTDRLNDIPLRELVYRVMELPASMRPLVWDFGQLNNDIEKAYIREIVVKHLYTQDCQIVANDSLISAISEVLSSAQSYMRERNDECSFVSLRDIERAMRAMFWFYNMLENLLPSNLRVKSISDVTYSLILSLAVCYRARLKKRDDFDTNISRFFRHPLSLIKDNTVIELGIQKCQNYILSRMIVDEHIAKNRALRENVFMMFVCIELRIPLFVIGKPGSSKSLAKTIISHNMQGNKCQDNSVLRNFSEVHIMSYQCSQLSTAEGIYAVFENCRTMQRNTGSSKFVSCVVLDEVGLAEDSPLMPLKVLHPLLEDSNYIFNERGDYNNNNDDDGVTALNKNPLNQVAFIGISNWSLDPAKMNRGIMVTRDDPDYEELLLSAKEICSSSSADPNIQSVKKHVCTLADTYIKLVGTTNSSREYYGLRDFYSLIKMLIFLCREHEVSLTSSILKHSVLRNFGGSDNRHFELFMQSFVLPQGNLHNPDSTPLGLIRANLVSSSTSFFGETRYLLLLTENYAALNILMKSSFMWPEGKLDKVRVLFGSSFPRDQDYSTACSNINKIKVCMETGKTVVLLHLELLYESLYDTLNQYYLKIYDQRFVDLGLGTHRMKCRVHSDFKLIVIADEDTVYKRFPTPLINRLEKHCLNMKTVLSNEGLEIAKQLAEWAKKFTTLDKGKSVQFERTRNFSIGNCFIGYQDDTPSSIVFQVMKRMYSTNTELEIDQSTVLGESQSILLQMATTDAVIRVKNSEIAEQSDKILQAYLAFNLCSLEEYLKHNITKYINVDDIVTHYTLATTHCRLMTERDVVQLNERLSQFPDTEKVTIDVTSLSLQQFQTEQQYIREIQKFLKTFSADRETNKSYRKILLVQCERGAYNEKLITCARYKTVDELKEWKNKVKIKWNTNAGVGYQSHVHIVFLVPLFKEALGSKFSSFCGGDWNTVHIDNICTVDYEELPSLSVLIGKQLHEIFGESEREQESERIFWKKRLKQCIQSATSKLVDYNGSEERTLKRMELFIRLTIQDTNDDFFQSLCLKLKHLNTISSFDKPPDWIQLIANSRDDLQSSGTFRKAVNLYINRVVTPILSELIAYMDRNGNLELLNSGKNDEFLAEIWRDLFMDEDIFAMHFGITLFPRRRVLVLSDGLGGRFFQVKFPFSFFIQERTTNLWNKFTIKEQTSEMNWHHWELYFLESCLGRLISNRRREGTFKYNICYLLDFIQIKIFPKTQKQCGVYEFVILTYIEQLSLSEDTSNSNTSQKELTIPKIHYAYENSKQLLDLIQEVFLLKESFGETIYAHISKIRKSPSDSPKLDIEIVLLKEIIDLCNHHQSKISSREEALKYVTEIRRWNSVVNKTLILYRQRCEDYQETFNTKFRNKWNRLMIIHLCMYYCCLGVEGEVYTSDNINLLCTMFGENSDFTNSETISYISSTLSHFVAQRRDSMELIATKCFIKILTDITFICLPKNNYQLQLDCLTINEKDLQEDAENVHNNLLNIFQGEEVYLSLSFKTYILQLMIKYRKDVFKEIFKAHLFTTQQTVSKQLFTIFTYTLEDSLEKGVLYENFGETIFDVLTAESEEIFEGNFSFELLNRIASLRFHCIILSQRVTQNLQSAAQTTGYFIKFRDMCMAKGNENLHIFLLKQLYHNLGSDMLNMIANSNYKWLLPTPALDNMSYSYAPDYFLIYGDTYKMVKKSLEETCVNEDTTDLLRMFKADTIRQQDIEANTKHLLYSIFNIISESIKDEDHKDFNFLSDLFTTDLCNTNGDLIQIALMVIGCNNISYFKHSHDSNNEETALAGLIYHMAILLSSDAFPKIFAPISLIYQNPSALKNMFFPTMAENIIPLSNIKQKGEAGGWKLCSKGHPYFVKYCHQTHARICSECGVTLDGKDQESNRVNILRDHGYILGEIDCLDSKLLHSIRSLSPASVSIIRALMDITFIWSSCYKPNTSDILLTLVTGGPRDSEDFTDFFYQHLNKVISDLARQRAVNFDEATLIIHLVIKSLTQSAREQCTIDTNLATNEVRSNWERIFEIQFIQPFLNFPSNLVQDAVETILVEDMIAKNEILAAVHEREVSTDNLSCLWCYKPPVSLDDFCQKFSLENRHMKPCCPFLELFFKEETSLSIVRYLPDIVKLQRRMIEKYNHRINKHDAMDCTIGKFLENIEDLSVLKELRRFVNNLYETWNKMGSTVEKCGRLQMNHKYPRVLTDDSSLSYILASSTGNGLLITSLTDYLVLIHNSFVHAYLEIVKESHIEKIPLYELDTCHVIEYEEHLQSLLLSHAHYSLVLGKGSHMSYDFEGVERQFMQEFVQNRPLILAEHLCFEYIREPHNLGVFEQVRQKVQQKPLKETLWRAIREDLDSLEVLSDVLLVLDVVIGFLVGTGGHPEQKLLFYLHDILKYPTDVHGSGPLESQSAEEVLLTHVLSFWNLLSVEKAQKLSILGQFPFSSLKQEFRADICEEVKKQLRDSCNHFSVKDVLEYLHQFILFYVRESEELDVNMGLNDCIKIYSTQFKLETPAGYSKYFPETIKLDQCIAAWFVLARQEDRISNPNPRNKNSK